MEPRELQARPIADLSASAAVAYWPSHVPFSSVSEIRAAAAPSFLSVPSVYCTYAPPLFYEPSYRASPVTLMF